MGGLDEVRIAGGAFPKFLGHLGKGTILKQLTFAQYPLRSYHRFDPAAVGCLPVGTRATF